MKVQYIKKGNKRIANAVIDLDEIIDADVAFVTIVGSKGARVFNVDTQRRSVVFATGVEVKPEQVCRKVSKLGLENSKAKEIKNMHVGNIFNEDAEIGNRLNAATSRMKRSAVKNDRIEQPVEQWGTKDFLFYAKKRFEAKYSRDGLTFRETANTLRRIKMLLDNFNNKETTKAYIDYLYDSVANGVDYDLSLGHVCSASFIDSFLSSQKQASKKNYLYDE